MRRRGRGMYIMKGRESKSKRKMQASKEIYSRGESVVGGHGDEPGSYVADTINVAKPPRISEKTSGSCPSPAIHGRTTTAGPDAKTSVSAERSEIDLSKSKTPGARAMRWSHARCSSKEGHQTLRLGQKLQAVEGGVLFVNTTSVAGVGVALALSAALAAMTTRQNQSPLPPRARLLPVSQATPSFS